MTSPQSSASASFLRAKRLRWAVPALVAAGVAAAAISTTGSADASDQPKLPPKTAGELLAAVQQVHPTNLSGTIVETMKLGLPDLPGSDAAGGDMSWQSLLTGAHTMRVWYGGPTQQRIAILAQMAERDVIHNGTDLWTYTSTTNQVTHSTVSKAIPSTDLGASDLTPQQLAEQALRAVDPTTDVTVDRTARVAGRAAYQLDLVPRDARSLIGSVRIAIDAETSIPLQVQVFAGEATTPAIQVGFTDISFSAPSPSIFDFTKPPGATMAPAEGHFDGHGSGALLPSGRSHDDAYGARLSISAPDAHHLSGRPTVLGTGWTTVVKMPALSAFGGSSSDLLRRASTPVAQGQLITTSLLSVLIADDGFVYVGPVSGAALQQVAATGHGL